MISQLYSARILSLLWFGVATSALVEEKTNAPDTIPKEVRDLVGTYEGTWTLFGIDERGEVAKRAVWTDSFTADKPEIRGGRAFVNTTDELAFEGGKTIKIQGTEGYFLENDGARGDYFVETFGQLNRMVKMRENVWGYAVPASAQELGQLGFPNDASGQHVLVKVVTKERGVETHRISRLSTVNWKDKDGKEHWLQFVSLQGFHKRQ